MFSMFLSLFLLGLSFGSGPCLASCGPLLVAYIVGTKKDTLKGLVSYFIFSIARILAYLILGFLIFYLGSFLTQRLLGNFARYIYILGGIYIISVGILMALGVRAETGFCRILQKNVLEKDKKSVFTLGFIIGLLPCAPLLALFSYLGLIYKSWTAVLLYIFSFGAGTLISPLLALVIFAGFLPRLFLHKKINAGRVLSFICGLLMVFMGTQLIRSAFY